MRKIIIGLMFPLLTSCVEFFGRETPKNFLVVGTIEYRENFCIYISKDRKNKTAQNPFGSWYAAIADTCGKFNVGDTIYFSKR